MAYEDGEVLLLQRIRDLRDFGIHNTSRADFKILASGKSDHYAILRLDGFSNTQLTVSTYLVEYRTAVELWVMYKDELTTYTEILDYANVLFSVFVYPHLGDVGTVLQAFPISADAPEEMYRRRGGLEYYRYTLNVVWQQEIMMSLQE